MLLHKHKHMKTLVLALHFGACSAETQPLPVTTVADSMGIRVLLNREFAPLAERMIWQIAEQPAVTIGAGEQLAEYQFFRIASATLLPNGTIVVANAGSRELRAYDRGGSYLWSAGGSGDGPGEFRGLDAHWTFGADSILAWDFQARRMSVFNASGSFVRSFTPANQGDLTPFPLGVLDDGTLVVRYAAAYTRDAMQSGPVRRPVEIHLQWLDGTARESIGDFPGTEDLIVTLGDGSPAVTSVVFGRGLHVYAAGNRVVVANDDAYSIHVYGSGGQLLHIARLDRDPRPVREEHFQSALERSLDSQIPMLREMARERFRLTPRHTTFPAFASIRSDPSQNIWVEEYRPPGSDQRLWQVYDANGVQLTTLETPVGLRILDIGNNYILGVHANDLGVESVRVYQLTKPVY